MFSKDIFMGWLCSLLLGWFFISGHTAMAIAGDSQAMAKAGSSPGYIVVGQISFSGNQKTLPETIMRELFFTEGDTLLREEFEKMAELGRRNLLNTSLFNFVEVETDYRHLPVVDVNYSFLERWYIWPIPILEIKDHNLNAWMENPSLSRMNYGVSLRLGNLAGRNEKLTLLIKTGYLQNYSLSFQTPYFNRLQNISMGVEAGMQLSRELVYLTERNYQLSYKSNSPVFRKNYGIYSVFFRPGMFSGHRFFIGVEQFSYADTLRQLNPRFVPGNRTDFSYMNIGYEYILDRRNIKSYPLHGHYLSVSAKRLGIGMLEDERIDAIVLNGSMRLYGELAPRWYFASGVSGKWSKGSTLAYYNQQGLGFQKDLVRGYENYVIDGQSFLVMKVNAKYALLPQRVTNLPFIPTEKFSRIHYALYLGVFADAGYVKDKYFYRNNPLNNTPLTGFGVGLDFVTYYDRVFRAEMSINHMGEAGVYLHIVAPI